MRPNLYSQEIGRYDPDLICLEEVNFGISQSNTSIQCPSSRWTAFHSSGTTWTVWVLPGSGCRNLRRHVWSSRWFFLWRRTKVLSPTRIIWALMEMQCSSKEAGILNILFNKWSFAWFWSTINIFLQLWALEKLSQSTQRRHQRWLVVVAVDLIFEHYRTIWSFLRDSPPLPPWTQVIYHYV